VQTLTQERAHPNGVFPQSLNNSRTQTAGVDMSKYKRALFTLYIGAVTSGSISAWLQESADDVTYTSNDTAGAFSNSSGSSVSATGMVTSNTIVTFEVRADQLTSGKRYVRLQVKETAASATIVCVVAEGGAADFSPATAGDGTHAGTNGAHYVVS
jgi:hypothetical protein